MRLLQNDNYAAHYRAAIYLLMDTAFECDFCFGDDVGYPLKKLDYSLFKHKVTEVHNRHLGHGLYWQEGVTSLLRKDYDRIILVGEARCLSTWASLLIGRLSNKKKTYVWTHGWYGKETRFERIVKRLFFHLPTGGIILYGNYARDLMIDEGFKPEKLFVIHNSLDHDKQIAIRKTLCASDIYKLHFNNNNPNLFFVGRLTKNKKLEMALHSVALLREKKKYYNLTFIGDGVERKELEDLTKELHLEQNVWFYGECYDEMILGELIYNADLCVAPGNIGLTSMHSLVFGTPALTHNDFSHQMPEFEAIHEGLTGSFFSHGSIESLSDAIDRWFIEKGNDRESVRKACMQEIDENWTPEFQLSVLNKALNVE